MNKLEKQLAGLPLRQPSPTLDERIRSAKPSLDPNKHEAAENAAHSYPSTRRMQKTLRRLAFLAATAAIMICVWLGLSRDGGKSTGNAAFAETLNQIAKAKTITWDCTEYIYSPPDGNKTRFWEKTEKSLAYKSPGLYREVRYDQEHRIDVIRITDEITKKELHIFPKNKTAKLEELAIQHDCPQGPFFYNEEELRQGNLQWVEKRKAATSEVNVFRISTEPAVWGYDLWIDRTTKQLVRKQVPSTNIYDPENDIDRNNPIGGKWPTGGAPICSIDHNIVFNATLDDSLFSMQPPPDYKLTVRSRQYVLEPDMIEYVGVLAGINGNTFPDDIMRPTIPERLQHTGRGKPYPDLTPVEQKYIKIIWDSIDQRLNYLPLGHFIEDKTVKNSFRYLGKGVKLGDKNAIVCWYKLKDAEDPTDYRVLYGDLTVKDVKAEELPLPVEP